MFAWRAFAPNALEVLVKVSSSRWFTLFGSTLFLAAAAAAAAGGCGSQPELVRGLGAGGSGSGSGGSGAAGTSGTSGEGGGWLELDGGPGDATITPDTACVATVAEATLTKRPVDIIFVIDNSPSMADEILSIQRNINDSFAAIIAASGVDYRVIMLAEHGDAEEEDSVCIGAPLSGTSCSPIPPAPVNNPPVFYHYSYPNESHNSLCNILGTYRGIQPDQYGLAPNGWSEWVRADSLKVFVEITDDNVACQSVHLPRNDYIADYDTQENAEEVATWFDAQLRALDPAVFGGEDQRNYVFHSIVGLSESAPATAAWDPADPLVFDRCGTAVSPGTGYQVLSRETGGLRFPLCQFASYDVVFQAIAEGVITGAVVACEYEIPAAPPGETIDRSTVVVQYTPGGTGDPKQLRQVAGVTACAAGAFYIEDDLIHVCPDACAEVQADPAAKVDVLYGCEPMVQ